MKKHTSQLNLTDFVSHELKTPLSTLKLNVELLKKTASSEQQKGLNMMEEEINWMIQFISDTLDLSQVQKKNLFNLYQHKWGAWVDSLKVFFEKQASIWHNPIHWERGEMWLDPKPFHTPKNNSVGKEELEVLIDPLYMRQALLNLIMNAIQHSSENSSVEVFWHRGSKDTLKVYVADQGSGIAKSDLNKIFKPFQKSRLYRRTKIRGSGLGLSIAKKIIEEHGGSIYAQNRPQGQGAVFIFTLPLCL